MSIVTIPSTSILGSNNCSRLLFVLSAAMIIATPAFAADFVFNIEYLGDDVAQLAPGSDDPDGTSLVPGDQFIWLISSVDERFWFVETGGDFFPLMAFGVDPSGVRTGAFELVLRNNGSDVFGLFSGATTEEVHVGTNTISLPTGLAFDEMFLDYTLNSAVDLNMPANPVTTTISGRLPIFGAPENNTFSPGIVFIPEPATAALMIFAVGLTVTRRAR